MKKILKAVLVNLLTEAGKAMGCILLTLLLQHIPQVNTSSNASPPETGMTRA